MDYETQILQEYFLEAREILMDSEQAFLQLEIHPQDQTLIDTIFRLTHTLKGSAFAVGLDEFGRFAHRFENMLDLIRNHKLPVNPDNISLALQINDAQKSWLQELMHDRDYVADVSSLGDRMAALVAPFASDQPKPVIPSFGIFDEETAPATTGESAAQFRILMVDNEKDQLDIYRDMLENLSCDIHMALNGPDALNVLRAHTMDVIIADLEMPDMSGLELIRRIRAADITTPIIFVSGFAARQDVINLVNAGANGFLEKPVSQDALLAQIRAALKEKYLQEVVAELTQLNFIAYLTSSQLARIQQNDKRRLELEQRLVAVFDDIIHLQNELFRPKLVGQVL